MNLYPGGASSFNSSRALDQLVTVSSRLKYGVSSHVSKNGGIIPMFRDKAKDIGLFLKRLGFDSWDDISRLPLGSERWKLLKLGAGAALGLVAISTSFSSAMDAYYVSKGMRTNELDSVALNMVESVSAAAIATPTIAALFDVGPPWLQNIAKKHPMTLVLTGVIPLGLEALRGVSAGDGFVYYAGQFGEHNIWARNSYDSMSLINEPFLRDAFIEFAIRYLDNEILGIPRYLLDVDNVPRGAELSIA